MDSPCLSNRLYIVKQQSYIDLKKIRVETLVNRKQSSWQSTNGKRIYAWQSMNIYVFHGFLAFYAYLIKYLKKNIICVFQELYRINYVKSVGFINLFLLQYRAPPELTEF